MHMCATNMTAQHSAWAQSLWGRQGGLHSQSWCLWRSHVSAQLEDVQQQHQQSCSQCALQDM